MPALSVVTNPCNPINLTMSPGRLWGGGREAEHVPAGGGTQGRGRGGVAERVDEALLRSRFDGALAAAAAWHRYQVRKGTTVPYISHLLAVTAIVLEQGGTEDEAVAALLHDAVEDTGGLPRLEQIRVLFGDTAAGLVEALSDSTSTVREVDQDRRGWRARKEAYLAHLEGASRPVRLIAAADKLHNCRSLITDLQRVGQSVWGRFNAGRDDQLWFYRKFVDALRSKDDLPIFAELAAAVTTLEALAHEPDAGGQGRPSIFGTMPG